MNDDRVEAGPSGLASHKVLDSVLPTQAPQLARRDVFTTLYKDDFIRVVGFVIKVGATVHEALDAAQAAFTQAWKEWDKIDKPSAWVRTVAVRAYFNSIPPYEVTNDIPADRPLLYTPETELLISERTQAARELLETLPMTQRLVMAWKTDGFSVEEIAKELHSTPDAVRQNIHRARTALKQRLEISREGGEE